VAMREAITWHFKGHPYGRDPLYALETLPALTQQDLLAFLRKHFSPANMVVALSGDIDREQAMDSFERLFRPFPKREPFARNLALPEPTRPVVALIPKPGQFQSQVALVLPSIKRTHPDYWKISLLMSVFGGTDSLLFKRLRDDLGLVYATFFTQTYRWKAGFLLGFIGCRGDMTADAILETIRIMKDLGQAFPEQELERKRMDLLNSFVFNLDTPAQLVEAYARYQMRGEPLDTLDRIQQAYIQARKKDMENLAKTYLDPARLQAFIVVDPETSVKGEGGEVAPIAESLSDLAGALALPFRQIPLR
jgi:zinc protease